MMTLGIIEFMEGIMKKRTPNIEIGHYRGSRYWGVWVDSELLAVVCYRKGAEAIKNALLRAV